MGRQTVHPSLGRDVWGLAARQHGVITRQQLEALGFTHHAIDHRIRHGRLHPIARGVYAIGRPTVTWHGRWMAAILSCGKDALISHRDAAALWGIADVARGPIHVSVPERSRPRRPGIVIHRRVFRKSDRSERDGIPVTSPVCTLADLAALLHPHKLEAAINEADKLALVTFEQLRRALDDVAGRPGVALLREVVDRHAFLPTDSELERMFLRLVRRAGVPPPRTREHLHGFRVDFFWPELGLVVEADGLRYHRTPAQQAADRIRDQTLTAAGLTVLRFTHRQVRHEPDYVIATLTELIRRLKSLYTVLNQAPGPSELHT